MIVLMKNNLEISKNIYFIGIGGIGISAIARLILADGKIVSGSDLAESEITQGLKKKGAKIFIGQKTCPTASSRRVFQLI